MGKTKEIQRQGMCYPDTDRIVVTPVARLSRLAGVKFPALFTANRTILGLCGALACLLTPPVAAQTWHSLDDIRHTAAHFVKQRAAQPGQRMQIVAGELDKRLHLTACDAELEAFLPTGGRIRTNTTVGVRCASPRVWKLFVPVRMTVTAKILVSARPLMAGTTLRDDNLVAVERDLSRLHGGYFRVGEPVAGLVLRRDVPAGEPIRSNLVRAARIVRRGQRVTIATRGGPLRIRMAGTALSDGRKGQRISVKNRSSGRVVEGVVRSAELIEIGVE